MTILDFVNSIAKKTGSQNEQAIVDLLSHSELEKIQIADSAAGAMLSSLMTLEEASASPKLRAKYTAEALNSIDAKLAEIEKEDEVFAAKNTFEKVSTLLKKYGELKKNIDTAVEREKTPMQKTIAELEENLKSLSEKTAQEKNQLLAQFDNERRAEKLEALLSSLPFSTNIEKEHNVVLAKSILEKELQKQNLKIEYNKNSRALELKHSTGDSYVEGKEQVSLADFATKNLIAAKLIAVNNGQAGTTQAANTAALPQMIGSGKTDTSNLTF